MRFNKLLVCLFIVVSLIEVAFSAQNLKSSATVAPIDISAMKTNQQLPELHNKIDKMQNRIDILEKKVDQLLKNRQFKVLPAQ